MKKLLVALICFTALPAFAQQFDDLTKDDVENVSKEFGVNFSHTAVAAPETDGLWGVEIGVVGGKAPSPELKDVVEKSGGDGSDFANLYHAGVIARAHFPFDLFFELNILPETEISDVTVSNRSFGLGWNAGGFFSLPLDVALGANRSSSEISFEQTTPVASDIKLETTTTVYWLGVSKTFAFVTPYLKAGTAKLDGDLSATASIFTFTAAQKENVSLSGGYLAGGLNLQFFFLKLGFEASQTIGVKRLSGKLSFDF